MKSKKGERGGEAGEEEVRGDQSSRGLSRMWPSKNIGYGVMRPARGDEAAGRSHRHKEICSGVARKQVGAKS
jgi:hypothetical protein